ncbi:MAG: hypothetical protein AAGD13_00550 [Pseudomonadota bacterium]
MPWSPTVSMHYVAAAQIGVAASLPIEMLEEKLAYMACGFVGAVISLGFAKYPNVWHRLIALIAGAASGILLAPLVRSYLALSSDEAYAMAMALGLVSMPLLGGAHALAMRWRKDPLQVIETLRGGGKK